MADDWLRDHQSLEAYGNELLHKVGLRNQQPRAGLQASRLENQVHVMLNHFNTRIGELRALLANDVPGRISPQETLRRQRLLDALIIKRTEIEASLRNPSASTRNQLLGSGRLGEASSSSRAHELDDPESGDADRPVDYRAMTKQLQQEQDRGLDMLDEIISRQKGLVKGIGNQIEVQNEIIEDIGENMDTTQVRLVRNTRNVERISKKSDSCCYWVIIILLLVAIVVASTV